MIDPEIVHHLVIYILNLIFRVPLFKKIISDLYQLKDPGLEKEVFGLKFKNPVGLAAGFDKDAKMIDTLDTLGFGFIEIGTLTPSPQEGNPRPRLFRLPRDKALINRMGFNNGGVLHAVNRLEAARNKKILIGGNIARNKDTPNKYAYRDYEYCFEALFDVVDYFVVNISSPNTPYLRDLQEKEPLKNLLLRLKDRAKSKPVKKPILLKIAPDLSGKQVDDIIEIVKYAGLDGIIATNTTISRKNLLTDSNIVQGIGQGGVSGKPVNVVSTKLIRYLREKLGPEFPIIGVGGIMSAQDALEKLDAGADLIQIYTGLIYEGPGLIKQINKAILAHH